MISGSESDADLIHAVFVAVERQHVAIDAKPRADGIEHHIRREA
jgi:hypothetical protein